MLVKPTGPSFDLVHDLDTNGIGCMLDAGRGSCAIETTREWAGRRSELVSRSNMPPAKRMRLREKHLGAGSYVFHGNAQNGINAQSHDGIEGRTNSTPETDA